MGIFAPNMLNVHMRDETEIFNTMSFLFNGPIEHCGISRQNPTALLARRMVYHILTIKKVVIKSWYCESFMLKATIHLP